MQFPSNFSVSLDEPDLRVPAFWAPAWTCGPKANVFSSSPLRPQLPTTMQPKAIMAALPTHSSAKSPYPLLSDSALSDDFHVTLKACNICYTNGVCHANGVLTLKAYNNCPQCFIPFPQGKWHHGSQFSQSCHIISIIF